MFDPRRIGSLPVLAVLLLGICPLVLAGCGPQPEAPSSDGDAVRQRAITDQTAQRKTGAELQDSALNRIIRTVYLCQNGEGLTVDFDNPRSMATVRNSNGLAIDLYQERAADGLWYRAAGYELRGIGALATWTARERPPTRCRAID